MVVGIGNAIGVSCFGILSSVLGEKVNFLIKGMRGQMTKRKHSRSCSEKGARKRFLYGAGEWLSLAPDKDGANVSVFLHDAWEGLGCI